MCRVVRADGLTVPILMLTARVGVGDRVAGLDAGADDCLAKPFDLDELLAKLQSLLQRAPTPPDVMDVGHLLVESERERVWRARLISNREICI